MPKKLKTTGRELVRRYLKQHGLTQKALAAELGIHEAHLSSLLSGKDFPSLTLAVRLENITGIPARQFASQEIA